MTDRENKLRSLLDRVRAKRPEDRETHAAEVVERLRTATGSSAPPPAPTPAAAPVSVPTPAPPSAPVSPTPVAPSASPILQSPTRYSSQPPRVERPLSAEPRGREPAGAPSVRSRRPQAIRADSVAPTGQPVVYSTEAPEFPRPKTFGELLELTLSLRPQ